MAKIDPRILAHLEWLGFVRPTGLVVSAPALVRAGAILNERDAEGQRLLRACVAPGDDDEPVIGDFVAFARSVLGWRFSVKGYAGMTGAPIPAELEVTLPDDGGILRPDYAVRELEPQNGSSPWQLLVRVLESGTDFDVESRDGGRLELSAHSRMERLLRQTGVTAGLLVNGRSLRLVSAPRGESSGWIDFEVSDMVKTAGRPICAALRLLLAEQRLLALPRHQRLPALLADSRRFQNEVSEKLAEQVLHALHELLRGFQAAHDASRGELLREVLAEDPSEVYRALLTVILRLVFLLYAEERDMLPGDATFLRSYSLAGLHERLREDAALYPDTMDQRYGAWAQLVALFRMVHDGASAPGMHLPPRRGALFDPDRFPFLEGRGGGGVRQVLECIEPPLVPDGTVYRALEKLLVLEGERISYRALDVEQIGSVYETMMGFRLETATGRTVAVRSQKKHGAPTAVDLDALLAQPNASRAKWMQDRTDRKLTDNMKMAVAAAASVEDLHAALMPIVDQAATPDLVAPGAMVLQPSEERRRSGSHYTPRELTEPIVRTTLDPIIERLRGKDGKIPRPEAILELKVCDPAMGSGAFLVESCRYLGDALVESWRVHGGRPSIPADEDEAIFARRLVAQRCLYGVDRNPVAVDLAKMSLWLATLARDHALTFVDHALRHGDSLVGLSRRQLEAFHWAPDAPRFHAGLEALEVRKHLEQAAELRRQIRASGEGVSDQVLRRLWDDAQAELDKVRLLGDLAVAAYFEAEKPKDRETKRLAFADEVLKGEAERRRAWLEERRHAEPPLAPFHWEIEFPEVFDRENPGFDAFVGNPPFAGKNSVAAGNAVGYPDWLKDLHAESHGNADLVAHFFRRASDLLRDDGAFGLIATNTIAQGDTRATGLRWICQHGMEIYDVRKRVKWPGMAAVVVSIIHCMKGNFPDAKHLDGRVVDRISAFLFNRGADENPAPLSSNSGIAFVGNYVLGDGFIFDDSKSTRWPRALALDLLRDARNREVLRPYLTGDALNTQPDQRPLEFIVDFGDLEEREARNWKEVFSLLARSVRTTRAQYSGALRKMWWRHARTKARFYTTARSLPRVLVKSQTSPRWSFAFVDPTWTYDQSVTVVLSALASMFSILSSQVHEDWVRLVGATMKDDLRYTPSDCFETFPFPEGWETHPALEAAGKAYYEFRAALMVRNNEGLTKTYNRFHDRDERDPEILKLRELHAAMDRAVLDAYGWHDIDTRCEFLLDYEIDEEEWGDRKKPWRYRWSDDTQAEILARLLELNAERARLESQAGTPAQLTSGKPAKSRGRKPKPASSASSSPMLLPSE